MEDERPRQARTTTSKGVKEFRAIVFRKNKRVRRSMTAQGWKFEPHPTKGDRLVGRLQASESIDVQDNG